MSLINFFIPSKGESSIIKTIESIQKQNYPNCKTTIGTDSDEGHEKINEILTGQGWGIDLDSNN